jgi:PAT family beta-lactamase induction signal transducer AmpG
MLRLFTNPRLIPMFLLGFASGLPLPLTAGTLSQWMTEQHASAALIGLIASVGISYTLKFLWSPLFDNARPPRLLAGLGRRRGWLATTQIALSAAAFALAFADPGAAPGTALALAALVAFCSASQDIVIDAWRIENFSEAEQGIALGAYIWAYRLALLTAGTGVLAMVGGLGWHGAMLVAACLTLVGLVTTFFAPEPPPSAAPRARGSSIFQHAVVQPLADILKRDGAWTILAFIALFKLGEAMAGVMNLKFYNSLGFVRAQIVVIGPFGLAATVLGFAAGGVLVRKLGTGRALLWTGAIQTVAMILYYLLAFTPGDLTMLYGTILTEAFSQGMADAAFLTFLSGLCSRAYSATHYALLSSLAALGYRTVGGLSGFLVEAVGWKSFYLLTLFAALPAMGLMVVILRRPTVSSPRNGAEDREAAEGRPG